MNPIRAIIFDLDGVIVSTDHFHYLGGKALADELGFAFDEDRNNALRGVSRMESLAILLGGRATEFSDPEKVALAQRKNGIYRGLLSSLGPQHLLPGAADFLATCRKNNLKLAIGSSSKNGRFILEKIGLATAFDAVVDGSNISRSKPDPEVFLKAAEAIGCPAPACLVVEDAEAGVAAAVAAEMPCLAVGAAAGDARATYSASDLTNAQLPFLRL